MHHPHSAAEADGSVHHSGVFFTALRGVVGVSDTPESNVRDTGSELMWRRPRFPRLIARERYDMAGIDYKDPELIYIERSGVMPIPLTDFEIQLPIIACGTQSFSWA